MRRCLIVAVIFPLLLGCTSVKHAFVDFGTNYVEQEVPPIVTKLLKEELAEWKIVSFIKDLRAENPVWADYLENLLKQLSAKAKERLIAQYETFKTAATKDLEGTGSAFEDFDIDKNGQISFNELIRLCDALGDKEKTCVRDGIQYLLLRYGMMFFGEPIKDNLLDYLAAPTETTKGLPKQKTDKETVEYFVKLLKAMDEDSKPKK